jgi:periplasmic mercuric ion binding protein
MKALKIFSFATIFMAIATLSLPMNSVAQNAKTETIPVSGNCGMCKSKIEKAAKTGGVEDAKWDVDAKTLTVKYNSSTTNAAKIQTAVAAVGYDTRDVKATNEAYNKLHGCCQYDRAAATNDDAKMDCCKDGKCSKPGHDGKDCCKSGADKTDCCKDGKCSKPGHDGKDCCKASH